MPAFKLSSLLHKDKSDTSSSRRSSILSDTDSQAPITSGDFVASPLDVSRVSAATADGSRGTAPSQQLPGTSHLRESGVADVDLSHRDSTTSRGLTLDTNNAKGNQRVSGEHGYSSSDDLDTPVASRGESELFQVRSRSSTQDRAAQAILTQPIAVDGLGPVVPVEGHQPQNLTPAQAVVFAVRTASPSSSSEQVTPNAGFAPQFEGSPMQSSTAISSASSVNGLSTPISAPVVSRSPRANTVGLLPPAPDGPIARRFSSASKRPASVTILSGDPAPPVHTTTLGPGSSAQSVMSLPAPSTAATHDHGTHTPAEILTKVKNKVRNHRHSADTDSFSRRNEKKMGKRERLKARLRASSDAFSTHTGMTSAGDEHEESLGDESDTTEDTDSDDDDYEADDRSVATKSSYYSRASLPVHGFAVASNKRNLEFHALFPEIDEGDYLIEDYGCALQKDILVQGRIYVSEHHLSFHANIFGWITNVIIAFADVIAIEKKMTAFVIPNAISISTRQGKNYTFASFISRDSTYDVFINVWRQSHSRSPSLHEQTTESSSPDALTSNIQRGAAAQKSSATAHKPTQCACGQKGEHYPEVALETVLPSTPEKIYNLMFASSFLKDWMTSDQKLMDLQMGDWAPSSSGSNLLKRQMTYIKPLNGSIGPKQTKCDIVDENQHVDNESYISNITTTRTPDVPSGNAFSVKTRTCLMWNGPNSTKVIVTTKVEFTARSFIKGIIEKSAVDGQKQYHASLEKSMREYMKQHASEFTMQGADGKPIPDEEPTHSAGVESTNVEKEVLVQPDLAAARRRKEEEDANAFQYALDRIISGGKALGSGLWALIQWFGDMLGGLPGGRDLALLLLVVALLLSNWWTYTAWRSHKDHAKGQGREVRRAARNFSPVGTSAEDMQRMVNGAVKKYLSGTSESSEVGCLGSQTAVILEQLNALEERIVTLRTKLVAVEAVGEAGLEEIHRRGPPVSGALDTLE
ncbi:hypothetical protein NliqN6_3229 [Naganishia liquefaciens]|uniref:VASt domain-containing protein n=1 Tax=Naganishia liquefaciens TaxID=104408 RepID=A0A8H3TTE8_9TREE|nr:hypothetical protein NliqN6_3229 [Naganishia liquefaciens]